MFRFAQPDKIANRAAGFGCFWRFRFLWSLMLLFGIGSSGSSSWTSQLAIVTVLWFSFGVHTAAGVIGLRLRGAWREISEHLLVGALRAGGSVEFCQRGVVSKERLQARLLRGEQLHLGVEHIQLHSRAGVQPGFGQAKRFVG